MINESFKINQKSEKIFNNFIPVDWLIREQKPDFYIDYFIEISDNKSPSGINIAVQLKGMKKIVIRSDNIIFRGMKTKHLKYYYDKVRIPVYLIIVDTLSEKVYWIFIQEYLSSLNAEWREKKTASIRIPITNNFDDIGTFKDSIIHSDKYIRDLWPSSLLASVKHKHKKIEKLDSRFKIDTIIKDGNITHILKPQKDVPFTLTIKPKIAKKYNNFISKGIELTVDKNEFEIKGSELFSHIFNKVKKGTLTLKQLPQGKGSILLRTIDSTEKIQNTIHGIECKVFVYGREKLHINNENSDFPLRIHIDSSLNSMAKNDKLNVKFKLQYNKWENKKVLEIPFAKKICFLFDDIMKGSDLIFEVDFNGMLLFSMVNKSEELKRKLKELFNLTNFIKKLISISSSEKTDIILPKIEKFSKNEMNRINLVNNLVQYGIHIEENIEGTKGVLSSHISIDAYKEIKKEDESICSLQHHKRKDFLIFNQKIDLGNLIFEYNDMKVLTDIHSKNIQKKVHLGKEIKLEIIATKKSKLIIKRV